MPNQIVPLGRQKFLEGGVAWLTDTIKANLVDIDTWGKAITGATNATPIVITSTSHGFANGDPVIVGKVGGNTAANNLGTGTKFYAGGVTTNTFALYTDAAQTAGVAGNGAYTSGGVVVGLGTMNNLSLVSGIIAAGVALASPTSTNGVANANSVTWSTVSGAQSEVVLIYKDTGTASTSTLLVFIDVATNLPVTPNGGNITVTWDTGANKIFTL